VVSEDGSSDNECNYEYGDSKTDDAFNHAQDMSVEEIEVFDSSDGEYVPRFELDFHEELDEEDYCDLEEDFSKPTKSHVKISLIFAKN
jgi:hypothetical protein